MMRSLFSAVSGLKTHQTRMDVIGNNIANVNTPGYKRKDLDFEGVLKQELGRCKHTSLDTKIDNLHMDHLNP